MFELPWSHLLLFGLAALVLIPSKDLPKVLRQAGRSWGDLQRMARDFRGQISEALRESELYEIKEGLTKDLRDIERTASMADEQKAWSTSINTAAATAGTQPETRAAAAAATTAEPSSATANPVASSADLSNAQDAAIFGSGATVPMASVAVPQTAAASRTDGIDIVPAGRGSVARRAAAAWKKAAATDDNAPSDTASESGA